MDAPPPDPKRRPPLLSSSFPITLKFMDVTYRAKIVNKHGGRSIRRMFAPSSHQGTNPDTTSLRERTILNGITGMASPGQILAVLGPSGSGKSTLLNAISGRLKGDGLAGTVLANGAKLSKTILRRTGFVSQDDLLYPHLTVRETLVFCSLLRLPTSLSKKEKMEVVDSVISELGLGKCENTIVGNSFVRGVSGGERKRVSIAREVLMNPSLLILDEPTSGLDSTAAQRVVKTLRSLAQKGKTVVTSVHQPSSQAYQEFDAVLLLSDGKCLYFGKGSDAMSYFESIGLTPSFPVNPADFLLDLANDVCQVNGIGERDRPNIKQNLVRSYHTTLAPKVKAACKDSSAKNTNHLIKNRCSSEERGYGHRSNTRDKISFSNWFNQFSILLHRSLKERRHESFNTLRVSQVVASALLAGSLWWHSHYTNIQDRLGLLFFISIFWGVFPAFNSVFAFPQERPIVTKERASGMYTLSSYFTARIVGDLPMELLLPTVFLIVTYWMCGLETDLWAFLLTLLVLLGHVLVCQGLGLALGAAIMDAKQASTAAAVTMLAFVITGGYYVHKVPSCMGWIKYTSTIFYCYRLLISVQYGDGNRISHLLGCSHPHRQTAGAGCKFVEDDVVGQISPLGSTAAMLLMLVVYRLLAYLALKRIKG
ncbi:ABC transporter G family member 25-like [Neltuma alba]|uniref:ABC transporter G family member 25-like n=1 Tax=Neltuma alba TaxID=207710 RepID=UPI0010A42E5C|nr:ABC transporter G family member 25-like [Prosopis alba]